MTAIDSSGLLRQSVHMMGSGPVTKPGARPLKIGLLVPQTGPIGMFGPSALNCARIAVEDINLVGGLLSRPVELLVGEGGGSETQIVDEAADLIRQGAEAIVGSHISPNRSALVQAIGGRIPYVYSTMYEGGEHSYGVFVSGETPEQGLRPLISWLAQRKETRRWFIVGNDYVFPRASARLARQYVAQTGGQIVGEEFAPLGQKDFTDTLTRIQSTRADAVLIYLVGNDGVYFNRQFAKLGLSDRVLRAFPAACENMLLGIGPNATRNLYLTSSYTRPARSPDAVWFEQRYRAAFGTTAPVVTHHAASCYDGVLLLAELVKSAGSVQVAHLQHASDGLVLNGARGQCVMRSNHLSTNTSIVRAEGPDLKTVEALGEMQIAAPDHPIRHTRLV